MALIITYDSTPRSPICFPVYLEGKYKLAAKMDGKDHEKSFSEQRAYYTSVGI